MASPRLVGYICRRAGIKEVNSASDLTQRVGNSLFEGEKYLSGVVVCTSAALISLGVRLAQNPVHTVLSVINNLASALFGIRFRLSRFLIGDTSNLGVFDHLMGFGL